MWLMEVNMSNKWQGLWTIPHIKKIMVNTAPETMLTELGISHILESSERMMGFMKLHFRV